MSSRTESAHIWRDWMWALVGFIIAANGAALSVHVIGAGLPAKIVVGLLSFSIIYLGYVVGRKSYRD